MKVEFMLEKRKFVNEEGKEIEFKRLVRKLVNGDVLEIKIAKEDLKVLEMSLYLEEQMKKGNN